jgi:hypothetical protein
MQPVKLNPNINGNVMSKGEPMSQDGKVSHQPQYSQPHREKAPQEDVRRAEEILLGNPLVLSPSKPQCLLSAGNGRGGSRWEFHCGT